MVAFLAMIAFMLATLELGEKISFITTGAIPKINTRSGGVANFVNVCDLGIIVPLALSSAISLWPGPSSNATDSDAISPFRSSDHCTHAWLTA